MYEITRGKLDGLRIITAVTATLLLVVAPLYTVVYGTPSAFTLGEITLLSPFELALIILGSKQLLASWLVPGISAIVIILLFGRFFCGWFCPVGIMLECTHGFPNTRQRPRVSELLKVNLEKYAILGGVLAASLLFNIAVPYIFSPPGAVYRALTSILLHGVASIDIALLGLFVMVDLVAARFGRTWCNTLCPLGTMISSLSFINLIQPKVDQQACIDFDFNCLHCELICPMRIPLTRGDRWQMMSCTKCLKCWTHCPAKAVKISIFH